MFNLDKLREELIRDEGLRLNAYKDSVGYWTIGVGHLLGITQRMVSITNDEAMALLEYDIQLAERRARKLVPILSDIDDIRRRAIINMAFNLGNRLNGFRRFLKAVNETNWVVASAEMMDSKWARQVGARAVRLQRMILIGEV